MTLQKCPWLHKFPTFVTKVSYPVTKVPFFLTKVPVLVALSLSKALSVSDFRETYKVDNRKESSDVVYRERCILRIQFMFLRCRRDSVLHCADSCD